MRLDTTDIRKIIRGYIVQFGMPVCYTEDLPDGELKEQRAVIATSSMDYGKIWASCIVTVSICVPDLQPNMADLTTLAKHEGKAVALFRDGIVGEYHGDSYSVSLKGNAIENDSSLRCHYVALKLVFETLNVINKTK